MINKLKNKLERLSISSTALGLMFLSLACTEVKVVEKPGETVYVEVPGETQTETVYVYVDQGPDQVIEQADQFAQDMDVVLNPDADFTPQLDAQMPDMDVMEELDQEVPELDQDLPEIEDMNPIDEMDAQMPEIDAGVIFDPSESLENLEVHPCPVDNSRLAENQLLLSYENYYESRAYYEQSPSSEPVELLSYNNNFWNVSFLDFAEYQEIGCFEYRNTGEEILVLDRLLYEFNQTSHQANFKFEFLGVDLPEVQTEGYRYQVAIAPENNIPILAGENIQIKVSALLTNQNDPFDFFRVSSIDPYLTGANTYILNLIEQVTIYTSAYEIAEIFYLDQSQLEPEGQIPSQQIINNVVLFEGNFATSIHTNLENTLNGEIVCDSDGGNYEVEVIVKDLSFDNNHGLQITTFQIQNGENRIPFQIQPMLIESNTNLTIRVNGENVIQAPQSGDTIQCHFERTFYPDFIEFYQFESIENNIDLYGKHTTWTENLDPGEPEASIRVNFDGYSGRDRQAVQVFENNPNFDNYLVRMELNGFGNYQNIDFNLNLTNNNGIFARAKVYTFDREELFSQDIVIPRGQSQHSLNLNINNQEYDRLFFEIEPIDDQQLTLPSTFEQFPPQIQFDLRNLEVFNEEQQAINIDADLWDYPRPLPFEDNAVRYYFNTPDMYLNYSSQRDDIIDIAPDGTLRNYERVELGSFEFKNHSSVSKCYTKLVFGKRDKEIELFSQIWVNDVLVIAENINRDNFIVDLSNQERCSLRAGGYVNEFYRPFSSFWMHVEFAGTFNAQTVETSDTIQISLLYAEGYFSRYTDEGELRVPFQTFFRDQNQNWSPIQFNIFNADGSINPQLINENLNAAPKGNRVTFIRHQ